ncbi:MAG: tetratricopeptide repeat protein [Vicinamibacterales bacterium]|jgi:lipopolysaccharide biosynthesis regulator YciM|nr:tetratricopeptide repeat protein [Vicinamibacterales bacterium]
MNESLTLLAVLLTLLLGLAAGKAWERYKLRAGHWIDRRKARESPHYILGLNFLVSNQLDWAIEELTTAAGIDDDALEIHLILGNLYREKGQVTRAIQMHQQLLQRPKLTKLEQAYVLLCLGLDFRRGGFVDRALEAFNEVLRFDSDNQYALLNLEKLHEEQQQWQEAHAIRQRLAALADDAQKVKHNAILAFLQTQLGLQALTRSEDKTAVSQFESAIELDAGAVPAYLNLGDVQRREGQLDEAIATWEQVIRIAPERAYLVFDRIEAVTREQGDTERFPALCRRLIDANQQDWRARLALGRHLATRGQPSEALDLLFDSLVHNPHALFIHQAVWQALVALQFNEARVQRYMELTREAVFYLDPHVCMRCRYRSTELLWQCPQCHEWNTFVEERITPAEETEDDSS